MDRVIHPITVEMLTHAIDQARRELADLLLIRLNTPGGMLEATRQAIEKIVASPVPVVTFVTPSGGGAASAGFFLLESGDIAAMADGTNAGAASAVLLGGQQMDPVVALPFAVVTLFLVSLAVRARAQKVMTGMTAIENTVGVALTALSPTGKVLVRGEYWNAVSATPVAPGTCIRVVGVEGLTLEVEPTS